MKRQTEIIPNPTTEQQNLAASQLESKLRDLASSIKGKSNYSRRDEFTYSTKVPTINISEYSKLPKEQQKNYRATSYISHDGKKTLTAEEYNSSSISEKRNFTVESYKDSHYPIQRIDKATYDALPPEQKSGFSMNSVGKSEKWIKKEIVQIPELQKAYDAIVAEAKKLFYKQNEYSNKDKLAILSGKIANCGKLPGGLKPEHVLYQTLKDLEYDKNKGPSLEVKKESEQQKPSSSAGKPLKGESLLQQVKGLFSGRV